MNMFAAAGKDGRRDLADLFPKDAENRNIGNSTDERRFFSYSFNRWFLIASIFYRVLTLP